MLCVSVSPGSCKGQVPCTSVVVCCCFVLAVDCYCHRQMSSLGLKFHPQVSAQRQRWWGGTYSKVLVAMGDSGLDEYMRVTTPEISILTR